VQVDGQFFGPNASRIGLGYTIVENAAAGRTISGVGVMQQR
jgi:hypothetical protein